MDIMEEWLSTTIQRDLGRVLDNVSDQPIHSSTACYEDDGSNLRVKASKKGVVQIIKWPSYNEVFQASVSDSVTYVKITIASAAAAEHEKRTGKRVTEETLGNIIQLQDTEIVATHLGPRGSRITLLVRAFKVIGSDKSAAFGSPRPFDATQEYSLLLEKLSAFHGLVENRSPSQSVVGASERSSPAGPRLGTFPIAEDSRYLSQQLLSQAPARFDPTDAAVKPKGTRLTGLRLPQASDETHEGSPKSAPVNQTEALLKILKAKDAAKSKANPVSEPQQPFKESTADPVAVTDVQRDTSAPLAQADVIKQPKQEQVISSASAKSVKSQRREVSQRKVGPKGIRSRDVRISKDQQELLDRKDSWLPAEPGCRGPVAHVPITVLEEVTRNVDQGTRQPPSSTREESPELGQPQAEIFTFDSEQEEKEDLDSEVPVSSADWPPSSPAREQRCELPPDSSIAIVEDSDGDRDRQGLSCATAESDAHRVVATQQDMPEKSTGEMIAATSSFQSNVERNEMPTRANSIDPSDSGSDLETNVPLNLSEDIPSAEGLVYTQEVPATAIQTQEPFLQVKRTPQVNWEEQPNEVQVLRRSTPENRPSPSKRRRIDNAGTARSMDLNEHFNQAHTLDQDKHPKSTASSVTVGTVRNPDYGIEETVLPQATQHEELQLPTTILSAEGRTADTQAQGSERAAAVAPQDSDDIPSQQKNLRRKADFPVLSPFVTKRYKSPFAFGFSQEEFPKEDPSIAARRYREEFFASRRNSRSISHIAPNKTGPGHLSTSQDDECLEHVNPNGLRACGADHRNTQESPQPASSRPTASPRDLIHRNSSIQPDLRNHKTTISHTSVAPQESMAGRSNTFSVDEAGHVPSSTLVPATGSQRPIITSVEQSDLLLMQNIHSDLNSVSTKLEAFSSAETSQRTNRSGQAQSLPELMTPALSVSDIPHTASPHHNLHVQPQEPLSQSDIFTRFKSAYPGYDGTKAHFLGMCKKIDQLLQVDRMEHKSLWDDFIIRHKTDYPQYLKHCLESVEDAKSYERFYRDEVDGPTYTKRIMQPETLHQAIPSDRCSIQVESSAVPAASDKVKSPKPQAGAQGTVSPNVQGLSSPVKGAAIEPSHQHVPAERRELPVTEDAQRKHHSENQTVASSCVLEPGNTIDLTENRSSSPISTPHLLQSNHSPNRPTHRSPRKIPWREYKPVIETNQPNDGRQSANPKKAAVADQRSQKGAPHESTISKRSNKRDSADMHNGIDNNRVVEAHGIKSKAPYSPRTILPREISQSVSQALRNIKVSTKSDPRTDRKEHEAQQAGEVDEWWKDDDTPFRQYAKLYKAIKPGRGNAWAQEMQKGTQSGKSSEKKRPHVKHKRSSQMTDQIDVMSWHL
ncbi:MAG: hypothetical protein Q9201_006808 [Fulgogasparrea decipioides]